MTKITFLGHGCLHIQIGGKEILVDPFISPNPKASEVVISDLTADYVLQTHGHGDHLADLETILTQTKATLVSNYEIATEYGNKGYKAHPMNHGGKWKFDFGNVKYVNAIHSSSYPDNFTMGYEDAVIASEFVNCNKVLGYHYDTFPYIEIDHDAAKKAFSDNGAELILLEIGGSMEV